MTQSTLMALAAALALAVAPVAQAAETRLVLDPEKPALSRSGWTYIGMTDGVLIYMKDAPPTPGQAPGARRMLTAYETLTPQDHDGFAFRSFESVGEFDCENGRSRVLGETYFEQASLKGRSQASAQIAEPAWDESIEGSVGLMRVIFACRERPLA